jgi:hypothetical protein
LPVLTTLSLSELAAAGPRDISDALEQGAIVFFPETPVPAPDPDDQAFLRSELAAALKQKNASYHPEADSVRGITGDQALADRTRRILADHGRRVEAFLHEAVPGFTENWTLGTCSFRPLQERGRNLKPHASNELVHIDAGAYGATHGDRILRFFVNLNPEEDRVWATKGSFPELYARLGDAAGLGSRSAGGRLVPSSLDRLRSGLLRRLATAGLPLARMLDSSPYDRMMRRFHNYMKDTPEFQSDREGHEVIRFPPFSAWMALTDMVSHASVSGQHALVTTGIVPLANCRFPELAPFNILGGSPECS